MRVALSLVFVLTLALAAGCATPGAVQTVTAPPASLPPALAADLLKDGAFVAAKLDYDLRAGLVQGGAVAPAYADRLRGDVHYPKDAPGPFPVVVFLHGMHATCKYGGESGPMSVGASDLCPGTPVTEPQDSYKGYDYLAAPLASHGFVVVSIDANQANDRDMTAAKGPQWRGDLVLRTLDALVEVNASGAFGAPLPGGELPALKGKLDLSNVGLMGHSRGGEGVVGAYVQNAARAKPYPIQALFALAPVDFQGLLPRNVPLAVLLPSCDGDVSDLEGAWFYDDTRNSTEDASPRSTLLVMGANHNFYNTVWTGDDASWLSSDPFCSAKKATRLTPEQERATGLALIPTFFRLYMGHETALAPLFTGDASLPETPDLLHVGHTPGAKARDVLYEAGKSPDPKLEGFSDAKVCGPFNGNFGLLGPATAATRLRCTASVNRAAQLNLTWSGPATATFPAALDASHDTTLSFRAAVAPKGGPAQGQDLRIVLADASGRSASVDASAWSRALFVTSSEGHAQSVLSSVRVPLAAFGGVDLAHLASVALVFDKIPSGHVLLTDLEMQR